MILSHHDLVVLSSSLDDSPERKPLAQIVKANTVINVEVMGNGIAKNFKVLRPVATRSFFRFTAKAAKERAEEKRVK